MILTSAQNVFAQMQGRSLDMAGPQVEVYRQAQELERQSREFYLEKADEVPQATHKELLLRIADEEARHYFLLDHMIDIL